MRAALGSTVLLLLTAGCLDLNTAGTQAITWEAQLVSTVANPDLTGQVAAAAQGGGGTDVGIGISGAVPGAVHLWGVWSGTCALPGDLMGASADYPTLAVSDSGKASAETHLVTRLSADSTYHAELRESASNATRIACGNLQRR